MSTCSRKRAALPIDLLAEFVRLSDPLDWGGAWVFNQILRTRAQQPIAPRRASGRDNGPLFRRGGETGLIPLIPTDKPCVLDLDECAALLEYGGPFSRYSPSYEYRPQQVDMLRAVANAFSTSAHLLVEAGTGTGKSFAYLVPAALWAIQNNARVVISTNTINLQDQLIKKDIPDLCAALGMQICALRAQRPRQLPVPAPLEIMRQRGPETVDEMRVLSKMLVWLQDNASGDRSEINLNGPAERDIWARLSAEDEGCKTETCIKRTGGNCPFYRARQAAQTAHLLVVNHALLLSDVATGNRVLPEYNYLIVDEGHHLESATTSALSFRVTQGDLARLLRELGGPTAGVMGRLISLTRNVLLPADFAARQPDDRTAPPTWLFRLETLFRHFFGSIAAVPGGSPRGPPARPVCPAGTHPRLPPAPCPAGTRWRWSGTKPTKPSSPC